ncbi:MAG: PQQ-binding-like beta-propeller repeat protein, partial [Verrucomicrobiales bacterium]
YEVQGGGAPVIAGDRLYAFGFYGEFGEEVQETLLCLDANTGEKIWEHRFSDYLSDIVYNRYGIGSPVVDPASGNIYLQASNGRIMGFSPDGKALWERSLMEEFGRLTFPNGRTGSAAIDGRLVIFHCVTANWGAEGPGADRFYAFDKTSGELVWSSSPGTRPVDSSFSMPVFADLDGHRVFYAGTGCGNAVCVDARTGKPLWRFQISQGGVNSQLIPYGTDKLLVIHGKENMDSTNKGRIVSLKIPTSYPTEQLVLGPEAELWRNDDFVAFTSSPVLVENRLYLTNATGELACVDADSGKTLWSEKLGHDQIHASPVYGDGKLYVPFFSGLFFIVEPSDEGAKVLQKAEIKDGDSTVPLLAAPSIHGGKVFLQTRSKLHAFGKADGTFVDAPRRELQFPSKEVASLQIVPAEFALAPGATQKFKVYGLDPRGLRVQQITEGLSWEKFVPPTAKVKAKVDASLDETSGTLTAAPEAKLSAGALKVTWNGKSATTRGRVQATYGYSADFDSTPLTQKKADGTPFSFPPLPWLGARVKWSVIEKDGSKVITNNLDNILFQRTMNFFGPPDLSNYILEADVMTDGNRRVMSNVGLVNQRYLITLVGNSKILEVSSNHERVKESVPFPVKANTWYRLKTHVVAKEDGTGTVFAKAWPRGEDEPAAWTIEVPVKKAHPHGAPAIYAFSPQSLKPVFIDNIKLSQAQ